MTLSKINNYCLITLTVIAMTSALIYTKPVLVPFVLALFIYVSISPLVELAKEKLRLPQALAVILTITVLFLLFGLCLFFIIASVQEFVEGARVYQQRIIGLVDSVTSVSDSYGLDLRIESLKEDLRELPVFSFLKGFTGGAINVASNLFLIFILVIFMLMGGSIGSHKHPLIKELSQKISKYIVVKLSVSLITGALVWGVLVSMKVELAFMFALLTVLLNFIPSIGSVIATLILAPILVLQFGFAWQFAVVIALAALIQFVIGNVIEPKIMGENMDLHPVVVISFLLFWGLVWGVPGMFLAVPITAIVKIILSRIPPTQGVAELLAGRLPERESI